MPVFVLRNNLYFNIVLFFLTIKPVEYYEPQWFKPNPDFKEKSKKNRGNMKYMNKIYKASHRAFHISLWGIVMN
jgi:hypothetical protein